MTTPIKHACGCVAEFIEGSGNGQEWLRCVPCGVEFHVTSVKGQVIAIDRPDVEIRPTPEGYVFVPVTSKGLETLLYTSVQDHDVQKREGWLGASGVMTEERALELQRRLEVIGCRVARMVGV